jgi:hypothetical protein
MMRSMRLFSPADYIATTTTTTPRFVTGARANHEEKSANAYIVYVFVNGEASELGRFLRETP